MILNRWRRRSAWICLAAMPLVLACSPACAEMIESCLTKHAGVNEARLRLNEALIVQKLCDLGMREDHAVALTKAMLSDGFQRALSDAVDVGANESTFLVDVSKLRMAESVLQTELARQGVGMEQIERNMSGNHGKSDSGAASRENLMRLFQDAGYGADKAHQVVAAMDDVEIQWVNDTQLVCTAGEVVGIRWGAMAMWVLGAMVLVVWGQQAAEYSPSLAAVLVVGGIVLLYFVHNTIWSK